jgi:hypothetical protein
MKIHGNLYQKLAHEIEPSLFPLADEAAGGAAGV